MFSRERTIFDLPVLEQETKSLQEKISGQGYGPETVKDQKLLKTKQRLLEQWQNIDQLDKTLFISLELPDEDFAVLEQDVARQYTELHKLLGDAETLLFLSGPYDANNALFEIHVGNGGDDAEDFASMLLRMYLRFFETSGWKATILNDNTTPSGVKSVVVEVEGESVFGYLQHESGVHRLIRISPFKSNASRQTSFANVIVTPVVEGNEVEVKEEELRIDTFRSSGAGGQKVNKTDSAIRITHQPTGIVVECQTERSQLQNKQRALTMLKSKLLQLELERQNAEIKGVRGEVKKAEFGNQIRTFTLQPYKLVKDHRTNLEVGNVDGVLDGDLQPFIEAELAHFRKSR